MQKLDELKTSTTHFVSITSIALIRKSLNTTNYNNTSSCSTNKQHRRSLLSDPRMNYTSIILSDVLNGYKFSDAVCAPLHPPTYIYKTRHFEKRREACEKLGINGVAFPLLTRSMLSRFSAFGEYWLSHGQYATWLATRSQKALLQPTLWCKWKFLLSTKLHYNWNWPQIVKVWLFTLRNTKKCKVLDSWYYQLPCDVFFEPASHWLSSD